MAYVSGLSRVVVDTLEGYTSTPDGVRPESVRMSATAIGADHDSKPLSDRVQTVATATFASVGAASLTDAQITAFIEATSVAFWAENDNATTADITAAAKAALHGIRDKTGTRFTKGDLLFVMDHIRSSKPQEAAAAAAAAGSGGSAPAANPVEVAIEVLAEANYKPVNDVKLTAQHYKSDGKPSTTKEETYDHEFAIAAEEPGSRAHWFATPRHENRIKSAIANVARGIELASSGVNWDTRVAVMDRVAESLRQLHEMYGDDATGEAKDLMESLARKLFVVQGDGRVDLSQNGYAGVDIKAVLDRIGPGMDPKALVKIAEDKDGTPTTIDLSDTQKEHLQTLIQALDQIKINRDEQTLLQFIRTRPQDESHEARVALLDRLVGGEALSGPNLAQVGLLINQFRSAHNLS